MLCFGSAGFAFFIGRQIVCPLLQTDKTDTQFGGSPFTKDKKQENFMPAGCLELVRHPDFQRCRPGYLSLRPGSQ